MAPVAQTPSHVESSLRPTVAVVDLKALRKNLDFIAKSIHRRCGIMAVVKADGYGHGMLPIAREAVAWGVQALAVGTADEALELRHTVGMETTPILVMGPTTPEDAPALQEGEISVAAGSLELMQAHIAYARQRGVPARLHVKLDSGMGRFGFEAENPAWFEVVRQNPDDIEGIFSHFATSDSAHAEDMAYTNHQRERFEAAVRRVYRLGLRPVYHAANSGAVLRHPQTHYELVRPGILMYGSEPAPGHLTGAALHPVLSLQSRLVAITTRRGGETLSYGRTFQLREDSPIGLIPVGYGDGYPRSLSNRATVLVHGRRVPVVGTVCMDQILVDLSGVPEAQVGDEVVLYGAQGGHRISLEETAELARTIPYELTCSLTRRVPRRYVGSLLA